MKPGSLGATHDWMAPISVDGSSSSGTCSPIRSQGQDQEPRALCGTGRFSWFLGRRATADLSVRLPMASNGHMAGASRPLNGCASCWISAMRPACARENWLTQRSAISVATSMAITGCMFSAGWQARQGRIAIACPNRAGSVSRVTQPARHASAQEPGDAVCRESRRGSRRNRTPTAAPVSRAVGGRDPGRTAGNGKEGAAREPALDAVHTRVARGHARR